MTSEISIRPSCVRLTSVEDPQAAEECHPPVPQDLAGAHQVRPVPQLPLQQGGRVDVSQEREQERRAQAPAGREAERGVEVDDPRVALRIDQDVVALAEVEMDDPALVHLPDEILQAGNHRADPVGSSLAVARDPLPVDALDQETIAPPTPETGGNPGEPPEAGQRAHLPRD